MTREEEGNMTIKELRRSNKMVNGNKMTVQELKKKIKEDAEKEGLWLDIFNVKNLRTRMYEDNYYLVKDLEVKKYKLSYAYGYGCVNCTAFVFTDR